VRSLAAILRVAIGLDRSHDGRVARVRVLRRDGRLVVEAVAADERDIALEVYSAHERRGLLDEVLDMRVDVLAALR
jgi:exopolyphosphatase/guanosine-5'-triphosphate,3'-diphosphate pyrophosphatase